MSQKTFDYKPHVDGLRAVAVLLVVLYHVGVPGPRGGFVGVDVFFVISGYLITSLLFLEAQQGRVSLAAFYARRVRRLFPAMLVVVAAICCWARFFAADLLEQTGLARSAARRRSISRTSTWAPRATTGTSTISSRCCIRGRSQSRSSSTRVAVPDHWAAEAGIRQNLRRDLLALLVALSGVSFVLSLWGRAPDAAFTMPFRAWQFGVGGSSRSCCGPRCWADGARRRVVDCRLAAIIVGGVTLRDRFPG
jgi:peptidoglycan/LPS O-acetylase OafA/YrhL